MVIAAPPGRDGRDGNQGAIGPRGEPGPMGQGAPKIAAWAISEADFSAMPVMTDGSNGPTLYLRAMFESYDAAAALTDDLEQADADAAVRAERQAKAEASRWAK
jgi:hypothetical protein